MCPVIILGEGYLCSCERLIWEGRGGGLYWLGALFLAIGTGQVPWCWVLIFGTGFGTGSWILLQWCTRLYKLRGHRVRSSGTQSRVPVGMSRDSKRITELAVATMLVAALKTGNPGTGLLSGTAGWNVSANCCRRQKNLSLNLSLRNPFLENKVEQCHRCW